MPNFIANSLPAVVLMLVATLIGAIAYRRNNTKQLGEIQDRAVETYKSLYEGQKEELVKLRREVTAMRVAFKQLGLEIEINGTSITIIDGQQAKRKRIIQLPAVEDEDK